MNNKLIEFYHRSIELTELLFNYLKNNTDYDITLSYIMSYPYYFKYSDFAQAEIRIKVNKYLNTNISIISYLYDTNLPFYLHLWKYNGIHKFRNISFCDSLDNENFCLWCLDHIVEFFDFNKVNKSYKQLTLFDSF